jgi:hypothetical protein
MEKFSKQLIVRFLNSSEMGAKPIRVWKDVYYDNTHFEYKLSKKYDRQMPSRIDFSDINTVEMIPKGMQQPPYAHLKIWLKNKTLITLAPEGGPFTSVSKKWDE